MTLPLGLLLFIPILFGDDNSVSIGLTPGAADQDALLKAK